MLKSNVEIRDEKLLDETVGEHIGYDLGVKIIKKDVMNILQKALKA